MQKSEGIELYLEEWVFTESNQKYTNVYEIYRIRHYTVISFGSKHERHC